MSQEDPPLVVRHRIVRFARCVYPEVIDRNQLLLLYVLRALKNYRATVSENPLSSAGALTVRVEVVVDGISSAIRCLMRVKRRI